MGGKAKGRRLAREKRHKNKEVMLGFYDRVIKNLEALIEVEKEKAAKKDGLINALKSSTRR